MSRLKIGVIGVGHLGGLHTKMLKDIGSANLIGVYDINIERAEKIASDYGTKPYPTIDKLLEDVDAVSIATSTKTHFKIAEQVLQKGKHIFIEKPITETAEQAHKLIEMCNKKVKIQVGHIERFNPALLSVENIKLNPLFIESHRLAQFNPRGTDVAVVHDLMIHDIDLILSLVNSEIESVSANGISVVTDNIDIANARLQFKNGCVANVTASRISKNRMRKLRLFQKDAYISFDFTEGTSEIFRLVDEHELTAESTLMLGQIETGNKKRKIVYEKPEKREVNALRKELESFVDAVLNDMQPKVTANDATKALEVVQLIVDKIHEQKIASI